MDHGTDDYDDMDDLDGAGSAGFERTRPLSERTSPRLGLSVPGAIGGVLLMTAMAFGANLGLAGSQGDAEPTPTYAAYEAPDATEGEDETAKPDGDDGATEPTDRPDASDKPEIAEEPDPTAKPTAEPDPTAKPTAEPDSTAKPTPKPTEKPDATPKPTPKPTEKPVMSLSVALKEGAVFIDWSGCEVDGGDYYKVVCSKDAKVSWPTGDYDEVVAVTEVGGATKAWDEHAPAGKTLWYRVFCVKATDGGYKVLSASVTKSIETPEGEPEPTKEPAPEPSAMWIEGDVVEGAVVITWEACGSDGFSHYRVLRKVDGDAGLLTEIEDAGTTTYVDTDVEAGVTYRYLVQAKGQHEGDWILLGTTEWTVVTVE